MNDHNGSGAFPPRATARDVGQLSQNVLALLELQAELFKADLKDAKSTVIRSVAVLLAGLALLLGSTPVVLLAVAQAFREWGGMSWTASYFLAALIGLVFAAVALWVGQALLSKTTAMFRRSQEEFRKNVVWTKDVLHHDSPVRYHQKHVPGT